MANVAQQNSQIISLNLIYDYPVRWSKFKVLRDFVQNFYDSLHWQEWDNRFSYSLSEGALSLVAHGIGFSYDWLLHIGASTKRDNDALYAGYFGEGFKIASLCALRDHNWKIEMFSRDWSLVVMTSELNIDGKHLKSLAYKVSHIGCDSMNTVLRISPFNDEKLLECVLLSFYYPSNPLFGTKIWESVNSAVYFRSNKPKPTGYPFTYGGGDGEGIIFAGYQALGSFKYPLIFCSHAYHCSDRERNDFFQMDVIEVIQSTVSTLPPKESAIVLQSLKSRWYDTPQKKYDFECWEGIIHTLVKNTAGSIEETLAFKKANPHLLVAHKIKKTNISQYNRRRQALDWLRSSQKSFRLVQKAFLSLSYPTLEEECERANGFSVLRDPGIEEKQRIEILEQLVQCLFPSLFKFITCPPCKIIKNEKASWQGMASCIPLKDPSQFFCGMIIRYQLPYIALKWSLLRPDNFGDAFSTYIH
ncbi:MAG: hypothetical protein JNN15_12525, partial [Blastocatellia bacterium]|nr:hypothetical protein [Blastocatellia bacterium]